MSKKGNGDFVKNIMLGAGIAGGFAVVTLLLGLAGMSIL